MLKIYLIRHGKTYGNSLGRYIGITDEGLCEEGIATLKGRHYPKVQGVYVSPLKRCIQSAYLMYEEQKQQIIEELAECNFGDFENKNYQDLTDNSDYQKWVDSGGTLPFPGGESQQEFRKRCLKGFHKIVHDCIKKERKSVAVIAHGGTIMSILEAYADDQLDFYAWHVDNGSGYEVEIDEKRWQQNRRELTVTAKITMITTAEGNEQT